MATSGSTNYSETTTSIIKDALLEIGAVSVDDVVDAPMHAHALRKLNRMIKAWQAKGFNLWRDTEGSVALVADQASYTFGGSTPDVSYRPLRISSIRYRSATGVDRPIVPIMARQDYFDLPEKSASGTPTSFYYDPGLSQGTLYIWPVPSTVTTETLKITYSRSFEDFDNNADEPDLPQEWLDAIVLGLAAEMCAPLYPGNQALLADTKVRAMTALEEASMFDRETASITFIPCGSDG
jgi:hypothetical protein